VGDDLDDDDIIIIIIIDVCIVSVHGQTRGWLKPCLRVHFLHDSR
jgi:hypothetical protein